MLPADVLATNPTLDQAIGATLRQLHHSLIQEDAIQARSLCPEGFPLLIAVEDISAHGQSAQLVERLIGWSENSHASNQRPDWRIICPTRPETFSGLRVDTRKRAESLAHRLNAFTPQEAQEALLIRASHASVRLSALDADAIAAALGYDPLLISLHDLSSPAVPANVISTFVSESTVRVSRTGDFLPQEYRSSLVALAMGMLKHKQMNPSLESIRTWINDPPEHVNCLRDQLKFGEILRFVTSDQDSNIVFRHDRVRKQLLVDAVHSAIRNRTIEEDIFSDPYFADIIGSVLANPDTPLDFVETAGKANPLALFHALHAFREASSPVHVTILKVIGNWLAEESSHTRSHEFLRYAALGVLAETTSPHVLKILPRFRGHVPPADIAGLRNGDLESGIRLCASIEPSAGATWRDRVIEHARINFGPHLTKELSALLQNPQANSLSIVGCLRLAGHLADTSLATAIEACWNSDPQRENRLDDYLWAAAQCGGVHAERLLSPVCDAWAGLPDDADVDGMPSPRDSLVGFHVCIAFSRSLPEPAMKFFIQRANEDDLRWAIVYMLHAVDHPEAVSLLVNFMAERSRKLEGTNNLNSFSYTVTDNWRSLQRTRNRAMSQQSRSRLQQLWMHKDNDKHLRRYAFDLWASTIAPEDTQ